MSWSETLDYQKSSLRWDIKRTMKGLCKRLANIGEECFVVTVNMNNGWVGHMGTVYGDDFINENLHIPYQFLNYCRESVDLEEMPKTMDQQPPPPPTAQKNDGDIVDSIGEDKDETKDMDNDDDDDDNERIRIEVMPESPDDPVLHEEEEEEEDGEKEEEKEDINAADETGETTEPVSVACVPLNTFKYRTKQSPVRKHTFKKLKGVRSTGSAQEQDTGASNTKPLYYCSFCHVTFKHWKQYRHHMKKYKHKQTQMKDKVCLNCKSRFAGITELFNHRMQCKGRQEPRMGDDDSSDANG